MEQTTPTYQKLLFLVPVVDFPNYLAGDDGNIYRERDMKLIESFSNKKRYVFVRLFDDEEIVKLFAVHRLIIKSFLLAEGKSFDENMTVDHI